METNRDKLRIAIRDIGRGKDARPDESVTAIALQLSTLYPQSGLKIDEIEREIRSAASASARSKDGAGS